MQIENVLNKGCGDDDAGAEVAGEQVDIDGYLQLWHSRRKNGEEGGSSGYNEDDEEG